MRTVNTVLCDIWNKLVAHFLEQEYRSGAGHPKNIILEACGSEEITWCKASSCLEFAVSAEFLFEAQQKHFIVATALRRFEGTEKLFH